MSIDMKEHEHTWRPIRELKQVDEDISSWGYSKEFIASNKELRNKQDSWLTYQTGRMNFREPLEVKAIDGEVYFREMDERDMPKVPEKFDTQYGVFLNHNHGEFMSFLSRRTREEDELLTEDERARAEIFGEGEYIVDGNFCDMFDCGRFIFAISNLNHMGSGSFKIVRIHENYRAITMFDNRTSPEFSAYDYIGRYGNNLGYIVVVSGYKESEPDNEKERKRVRRTILFQLYTDGSIDIDREWEMNISSANSIAVLGDIVYFGQNKMVTVLDTITGELTYLTNKNDAERAALQKMA